MKFSIVTVCFNSAKTIRRTLDSVLLQDFADYEYLVIDGGSKDGTADILKEYEPKFVGKLRWISEPDHGIYDAMNKGIDMANGEFLGFMNSDDAYHAGAFSAAAEAITPETGILCGITLNFGPDGTESGVDRTPVARIPFTTVNHQSCFIRKSLFGRFGKYNLKYPIAADYDFFLRAYLAGVKFMELDRIVADYSFGGLSGAHPWLCSRDGLRVRRDAGCLSRTGYYFHCVLCFMIPLVKRMSAFFRRGIR